METLTRGREMSSVGKLFIFCLGILGCLCFTMAGFPARTTAVEPGLSPGGVISTGVADLLDRPAVQVRQPGKCVLLDITAAGDRLVAVGERGIVVLSDDKGKTWRQVKMPTSVTLTAVTFPSPVDGWAVGHSGVVLHTKDGGERWERQLDGAVAARLALEDAEAGLKRLGEDDERGKQLLSDARLLASDGADKPFLDISFINDKEGVIVGAYGLVYHTRDAGETWTPWMSRLENSKGLHLYTIQIAGDRIAIAGEQGFFCCSIDGGETFKRIETPYRGSYFTSTVSQKGELLIAGLRGNAFWYDATSETFTRIDVPIPVSFSVSITGTDGEIYLANQAGDILTYREQEKKFLSVNVPRMPLISSLTRLENGNLVAVGVGGVMQLPLTETRAGKTGGPL